MIPSVEESGTSAQQRYTLRLPLTSDPDEEGQVEPQRAFKMTTPAAREVADLLAMQQDLTFVAEACDLLLDLDVDDPPLRTTLTRALWSSALIAYKRCFTTGKRLGLTEDDVRRVPGGEEAVDFHRKMVALRDKHVAHSVNPLEFITIGVMVGALSHADEEGITGLVTLFGAHWETSPTNIDGLRRLAGELLAVVMDRAEEQTPALREAAESIGIETVKRWPEITYEHGPVDPGRVRE